MGIFRAKGSSRTERRAVFSPFTNTRRLSNIAEEDDAASDLSGVNLASRGTPNRNKHILKTTPTRITRHRFQKLVDYGDSLQNQEDYQPPQDSLLQVQKKRGDLFFQKGPEPSTLVKVNNRHNPSKMHESQLGDSSTLKIFQFAAATASLSKSCSSESSVCSSYASSKRSFRASFESTGDDAEPTGNGGQPFFKSTLEGSFSSAPEAGFQSKSSHEHVAQSTTFPVTRGFQTSQKPAKMAKIGASNDNFIHDDWFNHGSSAPAANAEKICSVPFENKPVSFPNSDFQSGSDGFAPFSCNFPSAVSTTQNAFDNVEWPTDSSFDPQGFEVLKKSSTVDSNAGEEEVNEQEWPTEAEEETTSQKTDDSQNSSYSKAKSLFAHSESLFKQNKAVFESKGSANPDSNSAKNAYKDQNPRSHLSPSQPGQMASPLKENESKGYTFRSSVYKNKKAHFKNHHSSPLTKIPANLETHDRPTRSYTDHNIKKIRFENEESGPKGTKTNLSSRILTPGRGQATRSSVSFRFESNNERPTSSFAGNSCAMKPINTGIGRADKHHVPHSRSVVTTTANLGAVPRTMSPKSMHLFYDKSNSYDDSLNQTSTIDSCDTNSTATSVSTFVDASPRGIRGSFPTHLAPTFSSMSSSTGSARLLNQADYYKRGSPHPPTSQRPPTAVPPTSIIGSMLFQSGEQEAPPVTSTTRSISPKREQRRGVPKTVKASDDAAISDVTGSTAASDWLVQGNKLLNRYYYNSQDGVSQKKHNLSRQLRKREQSNLQEYQTMVAGIQQERQMQTHKNRIGGFVSEFNDRHDLVDKVRRHQRQFQYPTPTRNLRSGFDNLDDDDANSLFEA